ncbi:tetratricopeptide repeat protein [Streptomyces sp. NPDC058001]|uniref:tetratricopeptide repeat protein n=1 Tax=Streptomyces sp. NPDC058001 TaxID=3346300 RepID=UPI0036ECF662
MTGNFRRSGGDGRPGGRHVEADRGSIAAGGDIGSAVAQHIENAVVLPPDAYRPVTEVPAPERLCNVPRADLFVGREGELDALDAAFASPGDVVIQAVHGLGGIGKSALAARWAGHRCARNPRWWITADSESAVDSGLAALALALQPALTGLPESFLVERALQWLTAHDDWLIVLDNVDRPEHVRRLLDRTGTGRFLITTRRATGWHGTATPLRLDVLERDEAVDLFTRIVTHGRPSTSVSLLEVALLCAELGFLPLAVEQAAAFCAETGTGPREYRGMLAEAPGEVLADTTEGGDTDRTIARVWRITLDRLPEGSRILLRVLAWFAPDAIPRSLFEVLVPARELAKSVGPLFAYNMVTDNGDGTLSVHRLVQALARTPDADDPYRRSEDIEAARHTATFLLSSAYPATPHALWAWPLCRALTPHVVDLAKHSRPDDDRSQAAELLYHAGQFLAAQGAPKEALHHLHRAHDYCVRALGEDHPNTLAARKNLAHAYQQAGQLDRALRSHKDLVKDLTRVRGKDHRQVLSARTGLGIAHLTAGELDRAMTLLDAVVSDCARLLDEDDPHTLVARMNLASVYVRAGDLDRAIPAHERIVTDCARVLGEDDFNTLAARNNLANAYQEAGHVDRAVRLYEALVRDGTRIAAEDDPWNLSARNNLAAACQATGDLDRAVTLFEDILKDRDRILSEDHPDLLLSRGNLALAYEAAGDPGRAVSLLDDLVHDYVRLLGKDHPHTLTTLSNLAYACQATGDVDRAISLFEGVLKDRARVLSKDHPDLLASRNNLAGVHEILGDLDRAVPLFESVAADCVRVLGEDHPLTRTVRSNLANARTRSPGVSGNPVDGDEAHGL